jgi:hypothetical protein
MLVKVYYQELIPTSGNPYRATVIGDCYYQTPDGMIHSTDEADDAIPIAEDVIRQHYADVVFKYGHLVSDKLFEIIVDIANKTRTLP